MINFNFQISNKMKKKPGFFLSVQLVIISLGLVSCSLTKPLEFKKVNSFKLEENKTSGGIIITTNLTLYNPNNYSFRINNADIDVLAEGVNLGKLQIPDRIEIDKQDSFTGNFNVQISLTQLLLAGKNVIGKLRSGEFEVQFKGNIDAKVLFFERNMEVDYKEKIKVKL